MNTVLQRNTARSNSATRKRHRNLSKNKKLPPNPPSKSLPKFQPKSHSSHIPSISINNSDTSPLKSGIKPPLSAPKSLHIYRSAYKDIIDHSENNNNSAYNLPIILIDDSNDPLSIHKIKIPPKNSHKNGVLPKLPPKHNSNKNRNIPSIHQSLTESITDTKRYSITNYRTKQISLTLDGINEDSDCNISHFSLYAQFLKSKRNKNRTQISDKIDEGDIVHIDSHLNANNLRRSKSTHRLPSQLRPNPRKEREGRDPITFKPRRRTSLIRRAKESLHRKKLPPPPVFIYTVDVQVLVHIIYRKIRKEMLSLLMNRCKKFEEKKKRKMIFKLKKRKM